MSPIRCALSLMTLLLLGCDPIYGVRMNATLSRPVDADCIDRAIRAVPGIGDVFTRTLESQRVQVAPYRGHVDITSHVWQYGPRPQAILQVDDDGARVTYSNGLLAMGRPPPAAALDAIVPLMTRVNDALERQCGLPLAGMRLIRSE